MTGGVNLSAKGSSSDMALATLDEGGYRDVDDTLAITASDQAGPVDLVRDVSRDSIGVRSALCLRFNYKGWPSLITT